MWSCWLYQYWLWSVPLRIVRKVRWSDITADYAVVLKFTGSNPSVMIVHEPPWLSAGRSCFVSSAQELKLEKTHRSKNEPNAELGKLQYIKLRTRLLQKKSIRVQKGPKMCTAVMQCFTLCASAAVCAVFRLAMSALEILRSISTTQSCPSEESVTPCLTQVPFIVMINQIYDKFLPKVTAWCLYY